MPTKQSAKDLSYCSTCVWLQESYTRAYDNQCYDTAGLIRDAVILHNYNYHPSERSERWQAS